MFLENFAEIVGIVEPGHVGNGGDIASPGDEQEAGFFKSNGSQQVGRRDSRDRFHLFNNKPAVVIKN